MIEDHSGGPFDMMALQLAPYHDRLALLLFTIFYIVVFLIGTIGNVLTCCVILSKRYMQTSTNFYLCSLAISDLLILFFGLPFDFYHMWYPYPAVGGTWFCIVRALISESAANASILTIVSFTLERWVAICRPLKLRTLASNTMRYIGVVWVLSIATGCPLASQFGVVHFDISDYNISMELSQCDIVTDRAIPHSFEISTILFFVFPMVLLMICYSSIVISLHRRLRQCQSGNSSPLLEVQRSLRQETKAKHAVVRMLIVVVSVFFVCFTPHHSQRLLTTYGNGSWLRHNAVFQRIMLLLYDTSGIFYYLSTVVNPLIYNVFSRRFRKGFMDLLINWRRRSIMFRRHHDGSGQSTPTPSNAIRRKQTQKESTPKIRVRKRPIIANFRKPIVLKLSRNPYKSNSGNLGLGRDRLIATV